MDALDWCVPMPASLYMEGKNMSHGILINLNPNLFALCVVVGMATMGLLLGLTTGGVFALLISSAKRRSDIR